MPSNLLHRQAQFLNLQCLVLLKLVEIIGENELKSLDFETIDKVVAILNAIKTIDLRNEVLIKVLPLKV